MSNKVRLQGFAWIFLLFLPIVIGVLIGDASDDDIIPGWGEPLPEMNPLMEGLCCILSTGWVLFAIWVIFGQAALGMIITGVNATPDTKESFDADLALEIAMIMRTDFGVKKTHSGKCSQDPGGLALFAECGTPTNYKCPSCERYACSSCRGTRSKNGRKLCDGCDRFMQGG